MTQQTTKLQHKCKRVCLTVNYLSWISPEATSHKLCVLRFGCVLLLHWRSWNYNNALHFSPPFSLGTCRSLLVESISYHIEHPRHDMKSSHDWALNFSKQNRATTKSKAVVFDDFGFSGSLPRNSSFWKEENIKQTLTLAFTVVLQS